MNYATDIDAGAIAADLRLLASLASERGDMVVASFGEDIFGKGNLPPRVAHFAPASVEAMIERVVDPASERCRNVYAALATFQGLGKSSKGGLDNVSTVFGLVADFDAKADADAHRWAERCPIAPTMVLRTSTSPEPSFQCRFLFTRPIDRERAIDLAARLQAACRCDAGTKDVSHVWRIAGALNWPTREKIRTHKRPPEGQRVEVEVAFDTARLIDPDELDAALPARPTTRVSHSATAEPRRISDVDELGDKVSDAVKATIVQGEDQTDPRRFPSRSEALFWVACELVRAGVDDAMIVGVLLDPGFAISASVRDKGRSAERYARRQVERARAEVGGVDSRPTIEVVGGQLSGAIDAATSALIEADAPVFQRGGELVRTAGLEAEERRDGVTRQAGSVVILPVSAHWLTEQMSTAARWLKINAKGEPYEVDPTPKHALHVMARAGEWPFNHLRGIINAPTLRADGTLLHRGGYDAESRLILDTGGVTFPPVPNRPTRDDAIAALAMFSPIFAGFPFVSDADRSVVLAAMLTGLIRRTLPTAPLFAFSAPAAGTGKSKLTDAIAIVQTGRKAAFVSQGKSDEEDEKRLATLLRSGDGSIVIDNCERELSGDFLCLMLTSELAQARVLGRSERVLLPTTALVMASGNNLAVAGDMCRRTLMCRLDAGVERPDLRQFGFDPVEVVRERRAALVCAGLTVLRAYVVADRPMASMDKVGSFESWNVVREALAWLDEADPVSTREVLFDEDVRRHELSDLLSSWREFLGEEALTVGDVHRRCMELDGLAAPPEVFQLLCERSRGGAWNARSVGRWLNRHRDVVVGGLRLSREGEFRGQARWSVRKVVGNA